MKKKRNIAIPLIIATTLALSCKKDFLDKKPDKALLVPTTIQDFQAMLDNTTIMNIAPVLGEISADNYYTTDVNFSNNVFFRNFYLWEKDLYKGTVAGSDWNAPYKQILYANIVLDGLEKIKLNAVNQTAFNEVKGAALFFRGLAFYNIVDEFSVPYNKSTASTDLGIILMRSSNVNERPGRSTIKQSYEQILKDLKSAELLLPKQALVKSRPSKPAALALIARVYQTIEDYLQAGVYADSALSLYNKLIDYNTLNAAAARPFPAALPNGNDEVLFYTPLSTFTVLTSAQTTIIDSALYKSYDSNDLRKVMFFSDKGNGQVNFKGSYSGNTALFGGIATDELYLLRAECYARSGKIIESMNDLNTLLIKRWKTGKFSPYIATTSEEALAKVLTERRKELVFRGLRWSDLRRLNKNPQTSKTLIRFHNGEKYELLPGDKRYVFTIPDDEVTHLVEQNIR